MTEVVNLIRQAEIEATEDQQPQNKISNEEFQELIDGINFDEALHYHEGSIQNVQPFNLLEGINFDEPLDFTPPESQESQRSNSTPILQPFTSNEKKETMCSKVSTTSIASSDYFEPTFEIHFKELDDDVIDLLYPKHPIDVSNFSIMIQKQQKK